jgi:hypothetical protein
MIGRGRYAEPKESRRFFDVGQGIIPGPIRWHQRISENRMKLFAFYATMRQCRFQMTSVWTLAREWLGADDIRPEKAFDVNVFDKL